MQLRVVRTLQILVLATGLTAVLFAGYWLGDLLLRLLRGTIANPPAAARAGLYYFTDLAHGAFAAYVAWKVDRRGALLGALYFSAGALGRELSIMPDLFGRLLFWTAIGAAQAGALRFSQLFPTVVERDTLLRGYPAWRLDRRVLTAFLNPWLVWILMLGSALIGPFLPFESAWHGARNVLTAALALAYVSANYVQSSPDQRKQIYWIMQGIIMILLASIGSIILRSVDRGYWAGVVFMLGQLLLVSAVAFAVFYHGAIDPRLVVQRTVAISAATGLIVVLFVAVEAVVSNVFVSKLGLTDGAGPMIGGIIAALALRPVHARVESFVRRVLPRLDAQRQMA